MRYGLKFNNKQLVTNYYKRKDMKNKRMTNHTPQINGHAQKK